MPMQHVPATLFMTYGNVAIFHAYKDTDSLVDDPLSYSYSFSSGGEADFDVRDLPRPEGVEHHEHEAIIRAALDSGDLDASDQELDPEIVDLILRQWKPFDYHNFKPGVYWVTYAVADDTGEQVSYESALVQLRDDDGFPAFTLLMGTENNRFETMSMVVRYAEVDLPSPSLYPY